MLTHLNIERTNSLDESKAPFTFESTLLLDGQRISQGSFLSIKIFADDTAALPFRLYCLRKNGDVEFCDNNGSLVATWHIHEHTNQNAAYISSLLLSADGFIAGSIACTREVLDVLKGMANKRTSDLYIPADAFVLVPQCHIAMMTGTAKAIVVIDKDDKKHKLTGNVTLLPEAMTAQTDISEYRVVRKDTPVQLNGSGPVVQINTVFSIKDAYSDVLERLTPNGLCKIVVKGSTIDCSHHKLIIKSAMTGDRASNLRVVHENGQLVLKGVADV